MAFVQTSVTPLGDGRVQVDGVLKHDLAAVSALGNLYVQWWGASPLERRASRLGSLEPFANEDIAFEGTPNAGVVPVDRGTFTIILQEPAPYYKDLGVSLVPPSIYLRIVDLDRRILTPNHIIQVGSLGRSEPFLESFQSKTARKPLVSQWRKLM